MLFYILNLNISLNKTCLLYCSQYPCIFIRDSFQGLLVTNSVFVDLLLVANLIIILLKLVSFFSNLWCFSLTLILAALLWHSYPSLSSCDSNYTCVKPSIMFHMSTTLVYFTHLFISQCFTVDIFNCSILWFTIFTRLRVLLNASIRVNNFSYCIF